MIWSFRLREVGRAPTVKVGPACVIWRSSPAHSDTVLGLLLFRCFSNGTANLYAGTFAPKLKCLAFGLSKSLLDLDTLRKFFLTPKLALQTQLPSANYLLRLLPYLRWRELTESSAAVAAQILHTMAAPKPAASSQLQHQVLAAQC